MFVSACIALYVNLSLDCLLVSVRHDSRWSMCHFGGMCIYRLQVGDMSCLRMCFFSVVPSIPSISKFENLCYLRIGNSRGIP